MGIVELILDLQAKQFNRLLDTKRVKVRDAYYVIYSDYLSQDNAALINWDRLSVENSYKVMSYLKTCCQE